MSSTSSQNRKRKRESKAETASTTNESTAHYNSVCEAEDDDDDDVVFVAAGTTRASSQSSSAASVREQVPAVSAERAANGRIVITVDDDDDTARIDANTPDPMPAVKPPQTNQQPPIVSSRDRERAARAAFLADIHEKRIQSVASTSVATRPAAVGANGLRSQLRSVRAEQHERWRRQRPMSQRIRTLSDLAADDRAANQRKAAGVATVVPPARSIAQLHAADPIRIAREALELTNQFRARNRLPPFQWSQPMAAIAVGHSQDMANGRVAFGHGGFDARVRRYPFDWTSAAENVAMNAGVPRNDVARTAVDGWIHSPGHRRNLLSRHNFCGIGVYESGGRWFLTQLFARTPL